MRRDRHYLGLSPHGFHRIHYSEWGDPDNPRVLICVHGLTRCGRDFDFLAAALEADGYRVLCPDVAGRGQSQWLSHSADYNYNQYAADMAALIARSGAEQVDWVGTSMGGLIGMALAAQPGSPIRRLVVNDVGPFIPQAALERIATYVGQTPVFDDLAALERYIREISASFGPLDDAQWRHLAVHAARQLPDGRYTFAYDPAIADNFRTAADKDIDLWPLWEAIRCPVLLLRGATSDVLTRDTAAAMTQRGPKASLVEFPITGHAPMLMDPAQIAVVRDWLLAQQGA
ncbi:MAG TPA: alpha/beta hydrolase [Candidatus Competibacteraceae bacterium]|nr:alpha/beta hydrolase [Candidatus Competibacteraceae bacterium]